MNTYTVTAEYSAGAYRVDGWSGIAWSVLGRETVDTQETEWTGYQENTENLVCRMIGDDRLFIFHEDDVHEIAPDSFCRECGQIGCTCVVYA